MGNQSRTQGSGQSVSNVSSNAAEAARPTFAREIAAAAIGNALEWFDFVIYGYFSTIIAREFFPVAGPVGSLLLATATFGVGFVVRPFGGLVLGLYGDRKGRKAALSLSIWLMTAGMIMIVLAPPYRQAGWCGAVMLVIARIVQGFAASGEYGSAVAFLAEKAPRGRRNFYVSIQMSTTMFAIVLAGVVGTLLTSTLRPDQLENWGWRAPFVLGLLIGPVGYYIRKHVTETHDFTAIRHPTGGQVLKQLFTLYFVKTVSAIGVTVIGTVAFYLNLVYMPTFAVKQLGLPLLAPFASTAVAGLVMMISAPAAGLLVDKTNAPIKAFAFATLALAVLTLPLYSWVIARPSLPHLLLMQAIVAVPMGVISGLIPAIVSEIFPVSIRSTGLALSYNIPTTVFGGFSPLIVTWLISATQQKSAPAFYIIGAAALSLLSLAGIRAAAPRA